MNPQLLIVAIIAAISFGSGWHLQTLRYTAKEHDREQQELAQVRDSAASSIRRADNVIAAQNAAAGRVLVLRRDLGNALSDLERLRNTLRTMPRDDASTCPNTERNNTVRELFADCAAQLTDLAGKADRHASDAQTLIDAWPK